MRKNVLLYSVLGAMFALTLTLAMADPVPGPDDQSDVITDVSIQGSPPQIESIEPATTDVQAGAVPDPGAPVSQPVSGTGTASPQQIDPLTLPVTRTGTTPPQYRSVPIGSPGPGGLPAIQPPLPNIQRGQPTPQPDTPAVP